MDYKALQVATSLNLLPDCPLKAPKAGEPKTLTRNKVGKAILESLFVDSSGLTVKCSMGELASFLRGASAEITNPFILLSGFAAKMFPSTGERGKSLSTFVTYFNTELANWQEKT